MKIYNKSEWKKIKLGDIFILQMGKTPLRENKLYWDKGNYNWISISDMNFSEKYISFTKEKITDFAIKKSGIKIIPKNTVIMSFKLSIGKVKIVNEDIYSNEAIMAFIPKEDIFIDENFLYHSLKSVRWNEGINKAVKGLTLNKNLISQKEIFLPDLTTQKEITNNLDTIDNLLELRKKQLNYLKELGKSLFVTFNKNGIEKRLDDIADISMGQSPLSQSYNIDKKGLPFYQGKTEFGDIYIKEPIIYCNSPIKIVEKNDILMSVRAPVGDVNIATQKSCIGRGLASIRAKKVDYLYLFYLLKERKIKIEKMGVGSTFKAINKNNISSLQIPIIEMSKQNRIKKYLVLIEKLSFDIEKSIKEAENLYNSLMNKYFE
ncbi:restriction endonuclease subunit S [Fusobacterium animalis]|uniref:restriction endonuclease subunit S n=1 Tax=Fusobacterium animalis TaxID=76859 RepID=UPI0003802413|nr:MULTISPECIES: restriction endonuclease subunit S [Fusobacterium]ASG31427.1 restriction endonuclease subunit S [Fusobacterium animalis]ERT40954.1 type I restriction enzyme, S subunit [Fusobacterium nucleatum CTI-1]